MQNYVLSDMPMVLSVVRIGNTTQELGYYMQGIVAGNLQKHQYIQTSSD